MINDTFEFLFRSPLFRLSFFTNPDRVREDGEYIRVTVKYSIGHINNMSLTVGPQVVHNLLYRCATITNL